mmetsp:Transcript_43647/g.110107  ORF Transcript_43647/g.110107 Transcript_43647/m.110107 type:complete len:345 (+) Transcript_43647:73-1107(+)
MMGALTAADIKTNDVLLFTGHIVLWTVWTLLIRFSKGDNDQYPYTFEAVVLLMEFTKLGMALGYHHCMVAPLSIAEIKRILAQWRVGVYFAVPAAIYGVYNGLFYLNLTFFDPISYRVLINMRILWSGVLFQLFFQKRLGMQRWFALLLLLLGCAVNQYNPETGVVVKAFIYLLSMVLQSFLSSLGGVYNEFLLKKDVDIGMNTKNIYMYSFSMVLYLGWLVAVRPDTLSSVDGFFSGFTPVVYALPLVGALCGFTTAFFLRHLNIILKEYAHSGELALTAVLSVYLFDTPLTWQVLLSILLTSISVYLYNNAPTMESTAVKANGGDAAHDDEESADVETATPK